MFDLHWNLNKTPIKHTITSQPNFKLHTNEPITQIQQSYNNRPKTNKYNVFKSLAPTRNKKYFTFFVQRYLYAVFSCFVVAIACQRHNMRTPIVLQQNDSMCIHHVIRLLETDQLLRNIELKEKERERNRMKKKTFRTCHQVTIWICSASCVHEMISSSFERGAKKKQPHWKIEAEQKNISFNYSSEERKE